MIDRQLAHLAGETRATVGKSEFRFAGSCWVEQHISSGRVARSVFRPGTQIKLTERDPCSFAAPACLDQPIGKRQNLPHGGAGPWRKRVLKAA